MNNKSETLSIVNYSPDFIKQVKDFKEEWYKTYKKISKEKTPQVDGTGRKIIDKRPDGFDYIIEAYMRECLDKHFPGWSWEAAAPMQVVLNYLLAQGHLIIIDEHLLALGIQPPIRKFYGVGGARIQFKRNAPMTPENVVDIDKNAKSADSTALKYAINRLTHIGDDVYGKRIEEEGAGNLEEIIMASGASQDLRQQAFNELVKSLHMPYSRIFEILKIKSLSEITDYKDAYEKIRQSILPR